MQFRQLTSHSPAISTIGIGTMGMVEFYGSTSDQMALKTLEQAIDLGVNFIDTADMYGCGHSEALISNVIGKTSRENFFISTKCGFVRPGPELSNMYLDNSPTYIKQACEASLKRLKTDYIDLYFLHRFDSKTPITESIEAMSQLVQDGKIRYIGLSDTTPEILTQAHAIYRITAYQGEYSLLHRYPEETLLKICREQDIGFIPYSPLCRGLLSGRIRNFEEIESHDFRKTLPRFQPENLQRNLLLIDQLEQFAKRKRCTPSQLSLAWLLAQASSIIPIPGPKTPAQIAEDLGALQVNLSTQDLLELDQIAPLGCASGTAYPQEMGIK